MILRNFDYMTNMNSSHQSLNNLPMIDVNDPEFYNTVQQEIDYDMARLKKNIIIITKLRSEYIT